MLIPSVSIITPLEVQVCLMWSKTFHLTHLFLLLFFQSTVSSAEEDKSASAMRAHTALKDEGAEVDGQESCFTPLPTPEEKMRQQAEAILTDIVPINVTGKKHTLISVK